jgi:hypothetical protein
MLNILFIDLAILYAQKDETRFYLESKAAGSTRAGFWKFSPFVGARSFFPVVETASVLVRAAATNITLPPEFIVQVFVPIPP